MPKLSAGLLVYRGAHDATEVLLVHPGGPFWKNKDEHAWSIPKGEHEPGDDPFAVARREFEEELGQAPPDGDYELLAEIVQSKAKTVTVWTVEADVDVSTIESNTFEMEWPPKSGNQQSFPEVDRAEWFNIDDARNRLVAGQVQLLDLLLTRFPSAG